MKAQKQELTCRTCNDKFEFDPYFNNNVKTMDSIGPIPKTGKQLEVNAYLQCMNGHTHKYKVIKDY